MLSAAAWRLTGFEGIVLGMTNPTTVLHEVEAAFPVILLLIFMVAGIYFMKELLLFTFTKILLSVRSKILLSFLFCAISAVLSAFLDALTVTAVVISVAVGFYSVYHRVASGKNFNDEHTHSQDDTIKETHRQELEDFRRFLRNLLMHAAIGTALGGVCTTVGEPQNLLIASYTGWEFMEFFWRMSPVTMPVLAAGLTTCLLLEKTKIFDYGAPAPRTRPRHFGGIRPARSVHSYRPRQSKAGRAGCCRTVFVLLWPFMWPKLVSLA